MGPYRPAKKALDFAIGLWQARDNGDWHELAEGEGGRRVEAGGARVPPVPRSTGADYIAEGVMFGRGRPVSDRSQVGEPRSLTPEDLKNFRRAELPAAQKFRDSYHAIARLAAIGMRPDEIAETTGYGVERVNQLLRDGAMQARVEAYRELAVDPDFADAAKDYMTQVVRLRTRSARLLNDKLADAEPDDVSYRDLINISTFAADRSGFGKTSTTKVEVDLADRLAQALAASAKVIDRRPIIDVTPKKEVA